jgi:uncharacterized protein (TIGR02246 family)
MLSFLVANDVAEDQMTSIRLVLLVILSVVFLTAGGCQRETASNTRATDEAAIRAADAAILQAANAKDANRVISSYAEDAVWLPPNAPIVQGKQSIRAGWSQLLATPGLNIDWQIAKLDISRSGDLAYTFYTYQLTMQGQDGKPIADHGKDLAIWKKQGDGSWKMVADTFNSDLPAKPSLQPKSTTGSSH